MTSLACDSRQSLQTDGVPIDVTFNDNGDTARGVPDTGPTGSLFGLSLMGLALLRRRLCYRERTRTVIVSNTDGAKNFVSLPVRHGVAVGVAGIGSRFRVDVTGSTTHRFVTRQRKPLRVRISLASSAFFMVTENCESES
jgi:VPDSG-CTERM motif